MGPREIERTGPPEAKARSAWLRRVGRRIPKRLIDTGGLAKGDRITRRIPLLHLSEIDAEVLEWLRTAYSLDA